MRVSETFPPEPRSVALVRQFVAGSIEGAGLHHLRDAATLLVSELATNALLHARSAMVVSWQLSADRLYVEVLDDSPQRPRRRRYSAEATTGRGLALVDAMALEWGVRDGTGGGKAVWFTLAAEPDEDGAAAGLLFDVDAVDAL